MSITVPYLIAYCIHALKHHTLPCEYDQPWSVSLNTDKYMNEKSDSRKAAS